MAPADKNGGLSRVETFHIALTLYTHIIENERKDGMQGGGGGGGEEGEGGEGGGDKNIFFRLAPARFQQR